MNCEKQPTPLHCDNIGVIYVIRAPMNHPDIRRQHVRKAPAVRKAELLAAALEIAEKDGVLAVTRASVARKTDTTAGLMNRYFGGRDDLRWATLVEAGRLKMRGVLDSALDAGYERKDIAAISK